MPISVFLGALHVVRVPLPEAANGVKRPEPKSLLSNSIPRRDNVIAVHDHRVCPAEKANAFDGGARVLSLNHEL